MWGRGRGSIKMERLLGVGPINSLIGLLMVSHWSSSGL